MVRRCWVLAIKASAAWPSRAPRTATHTTRCRCASSRRPRGARRDSGDGVRDGGDLRGAEKNAERARGGGQHPLAATWQPRLRFARERRRLGTSRLARESCRDTLEKLMLAWARAVWLQARHAPRARHACLCGHARSPCLLHTDIVPCLWQLLALCPKGWWSNLVRTFSAATGGAKGTAVAAAGARAAATPTGPPQVLVLVALGLLSALAPG